MSPLFSIIIPCYNQAIFLPDCLNSLLEQSFTDWEAIVVNDGSTDNTNQVAIAYSQKDSRIKLLEKPNGGLSSARNFGIKNSIGARLIFLDADDYLYSKYFFEIKNIINRADNLTIIQCGYTYITEDKKQLLKSVNPSSKNSLIPYILTNSLGPCHTICITRELCNRAGWFDEDLKSVEDWDYWIRVAKCGAKYLAIKKPLVYYRYTKNSMSRNGFIMYDALKKVMQRAVKFDTRSINSSDLNKNYDIDNSAQLQSALIRSIGVSIMQGKIDESIKIFISESIVPIKLLKPKEFELMCSYLTFRYWYTHDDIRDVFEKHYPNFKSFFEKAGYPKEFIHKALYHIFKFHLFHKNIFRYGKPMATFINYYFKKLEKISL